MKIRNSLWPSGSGTADGARSEADSVLFHRVDSAGMQSRPDGVAVTYKELELDETALEQRALFAAEGITQSRPSQVEAAGLQIQMAAAQDALNVQRVLLEQSSRRLVRTEEALSPYRVRAGQAKWFYLIRTAALLIGDIAGISGAALMLGETYANSYILALSAATATVIAGLVGKELKVIQGRQRRHRGPDTLTELEKPFAHLFTGKASGLTVMLSMLLTGLLVAVLVAIGVYALRASVLGQLVGMVFGMFAAATALGSLISSYMYGDEITDLIENAHTAHARELTRFRKLAAARPVRLHAEKTAEAQSIRDEYTHRGDAAFHTITGLKWRTLFGSPGVVGHGPAQSPMPPIGRVERVTGLNERERGDAL